MNSRIFERAALLVQVVPPSFTPVQIFNKAIKRRDKERLIQVLEYHVDRLRAQAVKPLERGYIMFRVEQLQYEEFLYELKKIT